MNNKTSAQHVWHFPSKGLKAIFEQEIRGQLSDGAWENSTPFNHYQFWCHLKCEVGNDWFFEFDPQVSFEYKFPKKKSGYNLLTLVDSKNVDLSDRMRAYYVDAELELSLGRDAENLIGKDGFAYIAHIRAYAATHGEYWVKKLATLEAVPAEKVQAFHQAYAAYTRKDLIKDLRLIKKQMKTVIELAN